MLPADCKQDFFPSSLGRIHYLTRGTGQQVVLIHGNPTWSFIWRRVINELDPNKFEILAPDLLNLGLSDDLQGADFNLDNHIISIVELFRAKVRKGAILVVQDWGGPIGLLAAKQCPNLFEGYVVLNTGVAAPRFPMRLSWFHRLSKIPLLAEFLFGVIGFPMFTLHKVQHDKNSIRGEIAKAYRFPIKLSRRTSALKFARMVPSFESHPSVPHFQELEIFCRSLKNVEIVWGIMDPILGKQIKKVREIFKQARVTELTAGHFLQEEAFKQIACSIETLSKQSRSI